MERKETKRSILQILRCMS